MNVVSNQETHDDSQALNRELNSKIIKMGYLWSCYGAIVTLIIVLTPEAIMRTSLVRAVMGLTLTTMPFVQYLASLSTAPDVVVYSYSVVLFSAPIHAVFSISAVVMNYMAGYDGYEKNKKTVLLFGWLAPLMVWSIFFCCFGCDGKPGWHERFAISNRLAMAFLGQSLFVGASIGIGIYLLALLIKIGLIEKQHPSKAGRNGIRKQF